MIAGRVNFERNYPGIKTVSIEYLVHPEFDEEFGMFHEGENDNFAILQLIADGKDLTCTRMGEILADNLWADMIAAHITGEDFFS